MAAPNEQQREATKGYNAEEEAHVLLNCFSEKGEHATWARESRNEPSGEHNVFLEIGGNDTLNPRITSWTKVNFAKNHPKVRVRFLWSIYSYSVIYLLKDIQSSPI